MAIQIKHHTIMWHSPGDEPRDNEVACYCTKCQQEIYIGEKSYEQGPQVMCPDCFQDHVQSLLDKDPAFIAQALGYEVYSHEL